MYRQNIAIRTGAHRILTAFMAVWLSGFVFLFCCEFARAATAENEHCPLAAAQKHCDKSAKTNSLAVSYPAGASIECCGFLSSVYDKARKVESGDKSLVPVPSVASLSADRVVVKHSTLSRVAYSPPPIYRDKIFIRHRILRI